MDVYKGNWIGFKYDFPENNRDIQSGETFKLQFQGTEIILYDYLWTDEDYQQILVITSYSIHYTKLYEGIPPG